MQRRTFLQTFIFSSGIIMINQGYLSGTKPDENAFKILMVYNNTGETSNLKNEWGLSVWIEHHKTAILFDTGGDASILWYNILRSKIEVDKLSKVVISHNHWDHINGLSLILEKTANRPEIYVVGKDHKEYRSKYPNSKIISITKAEKIAPDIWTTGQLKAVYDGSELNEQSLILMHHNSIVLLTGCSHSGIVEMVQTIREMFPDKKFELVAGGFHLMNKSNDEISDISNRLKNLGVEKIAPSHCTGKQAIAIFKADWGDKFLNINLGNEIII